MCILSFVRAHLSAQQKSKASKAVKMCVSTSECVCEKERLRVDARMRTRGHACVVHVCMHTYVCVNVFVSTPATPTPGCPCDPVPRPLSFPPPCCQVSRTSVVHCVVFKCVQVCMWERETREKIRERTVPRRASIRCKVGTEDMCIYI